MASYYKKITSGVMEERYSFLSGGVSVYLKETDKYEASLNTTKTEAALLANGFVAINSSEWNSYVDDIESFARIGNHPPQKPA